MESKDHIVEREIEDEMKQSYLDYSMSVIIGRALPNVCDGLKPVHRRILYAMHDLGMVHNKPYKKSARIVGEVLGKYHPHGDTAVYDSMVRMVQDFALRYPLINGQGNFGSIDGDNAAAMRYTEARMGILAEEILEDIEKETVEFVPNFDNSLKEPFVLPSKFPNLLVNGSSGIAVGMATNMPPHNCKEVCEGIIATIDDPDIDVHKLTMVVTGPDFPTGGQIIGRKGILSAYHTGRGKVLVRSRHHVEEEKNKNKIIITEIPYQVNKSMLIEHIANLVKDKKIVGITDLRDESDRDGMRIVIEVKKEANTDVLMNQLYSHSKLQVTFGIINLAIVENVPKVLPLKTLIVHFIDHRKSIVRKRTEFDLKKAEERSHILEGLIIALNNIDEVIKKIKSAKSAKEAKEDLIATYALSEKQAQAILEMRLQKLTGLEQNKIRDEQQELLKIIAELKSILADEKKILAIIKDELTEIKEKYGDGRKTDIIEGDFEEMLEEDLIEEEEMVITITHSGYIKRIPLDTYRAQRRGGKGIIATTTKEEDVVEDIFIANTHDQILFFTNTGQVHWLKVFQLPQASRQARGSAIINLLNLPKEQKVTTFIKVKKYDKDHFLMLATGKGTIKKSPLSDFSRPRQGGIRAISLDEGDALIGAVLTDGTNQIMLATKGGMAVKFNEKDVRAMGRSARGVRGINLNTEDRVVSMLIAPDEKTLLTITKNGYGKRTKIVDYRLTARGGKGVKNIICSPRNGEVVSVHLVEESDHMMFISQKGITIRTEAKGIPTIGRNTQGVRIMKISSDDAVVAAAKIANEEEPKNGSESNQNNKPDDDRENTNDSEVQDESHSSSATSEVKSTSQETDTLSQKENLSVDQQSVNAEEKEETSSPSLNKLKELTKKMQGE